MAIMNWTCFDMHPGTTMRYLQYTPYAFRPIQPPLPLAIQWLFEKKKNHDEIWRSMVPRVLPAQQSRTVLLGPVHELHRRGMSAQCTKCLERDIAYEEPHACAQCGCSEAVERANRVDVDRVGGIARHDCTNWDMINHGMTSSTVLQHLLCVGNDCRCFTELG